MKLTRFETELKEAIQRGDFEILKLSKKEKDKYREAAKAALAKDRSITIRINGNDLKAIKDIAIKSGKKYQTYIGDLLHEHVAKRRHAA
jgi:predicted DNA binding CopG/RHH family protein